MTKMLIEAGANIQARNNTTGCVPLHDAAEHGNFEAVKQLLELGAPHLPRSADGELPIDFAKSGGHANIVSFLGKTEIAYQKSNEIMLSLNFQKIIRRRQPLFISFSGITAP